MKKQLVFAVILLAVGTFFSLAAAQYPHPPANPPPPPPSPPNDNVCFYARPYYQGPAFCAKPGINTPDASQILVNGRYENWENRIQSIQLFGNAKVTIYNGRQYTGTLVRLNLSQPDLRQVSTTQGYYNWANQISSYITTW